MSDFDPDAFLAETGGFDPDAFLAEAASQEIAPPARDKVLTPRTGVGSALEALGLLEPAIERAGKPKVGELETYLNKAANMVPLGGVLTDLASTGLMEFAGGGTPGARLTDKAKAELAALGENVDKQPTLTDVYRRLRDVRRARTEAGEEQNPLAALAGSGTGLGLGMLAPLPKFTPKGGQAATTGAKVLAGAKTGGAYGGLAGLTSGDADTAGGDFTGTALQGAFGTALGSLLGGAVPAAGAFGNRLLRGVVRPTAAAKALQEEGVEGLTLGQMDPKSPLGAIEGTAQATPGIGTVLQGQRERAVDSLRQVAFKRGVAPGATPPADDMTPPQAIAHLRKGFNQAYDEIRDVPVPTRAVDRLLVAVDDPEIIADPATRLAVSKFLQNQMGRLPADGTSTTAGMLMKIREKVREEAFKALRANNMDRAALLERAEAELTEGLNTGLPGVAAQKLQATDAAYRNFKILQDAVAGAGDTAQGPGMFTQKGLSSAVDRATGDTSYAELGGGPLRKLSSAAAQAFAEPPKTGWSALGGPWVRGITGPLLIAANRPGVQPTMLGQAQWQQSARPVADALQRYLARINTGPQTLAPQALFEALRDTPQENP